MTFIFRSLILGALFIFAVGCGNSNKSGGSPATTAPLAENYQSGSLDASGAQVFEGLRRWYNGSVEGTRALGLVRVEKLQSSNECDTIQLIFGIEIDYCANFSFSNSNWNVISSVEMNLIQDGRIINQRGNQNLDDLFSGRAGQILGAISLGQNVVRVDVLKDQSQIESYIIDKNYHSLINPVQKFSNAQGGENIKVRIECVNASVPHNFPGGCTIQ